MIAHTALLAALVLFLLVAWFIDEVAFLAVHRDAIVESYGYRILLVALIAFFNLAAGFYLTASWLFLRETGRKLAHVDRQLMTSDSVLDELRQHLES